MKRFVLVGALLLAFFVSICQDHQKQYDSIDYYINIGYATKALALTKKLPEKDPQLQFKKLRYQSLVQFTTLELRAALSNLNKAYALVKNRSVKLKAEQNEELLFDFYDAYFLMNELEKADSVLEAIRNTFPKNIPLDYYSNKYELLKKTGRVDEAADFMDTEIQPISHLFYELQADDYVTSGDYSYAASFVEEALEILKDLYPKDIAQLEINFYPHRIQSAETLPYLKAVIAEGSWKGKMESHLDWLQLVGAKAYELGDRNFGDSIFHRCIEISTSAFGERNLYHVSALIALLRIATNSDDLMHARNYSEQVEALLKVMLGENSTYFRALMFEVMRFKILLGEIEEVNDFTLKSISIVESQAGRKHPTYSTYAAYYYKNNPDKPGSNQFLVEAAKQYSLDDNNCNGCYALVLSNLASSLERTGDVKQAEYYFRRAWEKAKVAPDQEVFYRQLLTDFYRRCHALKLHDQLVHFPQEITTIRNDSIFTTYKYMSDEEMIYLNDLQRNYEDALVTATISERNEINYSKAKLAWSENREQEATNAFQTSMSEIIKGLSVLEFLNENEKAEYFKSAIEPINAFYSFSVSLNTLSSGFLMEDKYTDAINRYKADSTSYKIEKVKYGNVNYHRFTLLHSKKALDVRLATKGMVFSSTRRVHTLRDMRGLKCL